MSTQVVTPQINHSYLHPIFAPADLEAAASTAGATRVAGGGFLQIAAATPFLTVTGLTTGQFRLRVKLTSMEGGADGRSPATLIVTPDAGNVTQAAATCGTIQSVNGLGTAQIDFVPDNTDAARGWADIIVTCEGATTVSLQLRHRRFLATASDYTLAA